jgi:hypothetical protein
MKNWIFKQSQLNARIRARKNEEGSGEVWKRENEQ